MANNFKNVWIFILIFFSGLQTGAQAGAWVQPKSTYYLKFSTHYFFTREEFDHTGEKIPFLGPLTPFDAYFREISFSVYAEYGLLENLTLVGRLPFKAYTVHREIPGLQEITATTTGFADINLAARQLLLSDPLVLSVEGGFKIPLGYSENPKNDGPRLGSGAVDLELNLLAGKSLYPLPIYVNTRFGYRYRGGELHDEWLFAGEIGLFLGRILLKTDLEMISNREDPPDKYGRTIVTPLPGGGGDLPDPTVNDENILKISPSLIIPLKGSISFQFAVTSILAGKSTIAGTSYSISLILN